MKTRKKYIPLTRQFEKVTANHRNKQWILHPGCETRPVLTVISRTQAFLKTAILIFV